MTESSESVQIGDRIRFSGELLEEMTKQEYPLVRVVEIRLAADGSKLLVVRFAEQQRPAD